MYHSTFGCGLVALLQFEGGAWRSLLRQPGINYLVWLRSWGDVLK